MRTETLETKEMIRTERLVIRVAADDEMRAFIAAQSVDELRQAYGEMLNGCIAHPEERIWYAIWMIELSDGTHIGELSFKGLSSAGVVEIGYGILPEYQGQGYATEAVTAATVWASGQPKVRRIEAETEADNIASQKVLEKAGYIASGISGEEGPRFVWAKK